MTPPQPTPRPVRTSASLLYFAIHIALLVLEVAAIVPAAYCIVGFGGFALLSDDGDRASWLLGHVAAFAAGMLLLLAFTIACVIYGLWSLRLTWRALWPCLGVAGSVLIIGFGATASLQLTLSAAALYLG